MIIKSSLQIREFYNLFLEIVHIYLIVYVHIYLNVYTTSSRQKREEQDQADFMLIKQAYEFRGYKKGARSIYMRLLHMNPPIVMNLKKWYYVKFEDNLNFCFLTNPKKFVPLSIDYGSLSLRTHFLLLFKLPALAAA